MPLFPSDFKKFQYLEHDDKSVTLQHPKGHKIIIAKKALKGDLRKQMDAMCEGGVTKKAEGGAIAEVRRSGSAGEGAQTTQELRDEANPTPKPMTGTDVRTPEQKQKAAAYYDTPKQTPNEGPASTDKDGYQKFAEGDLVSKDKMIEVPASELARITQEYNASKAPSTEAPSIDPAPVRQEQAQPQGEAFSMERLGPELSKVHQDRSLTDSLNPQQNLVAANTPAPQADTSIAPPLPTATGQGIAPQGAPPAKDVLSQAPDASMIQSGYGNALAGINQQATAQAALGQEQNQILQKQAESRAVAEHAYQQHYNDLDSERQNLQHDIQTGQIDPEKFWNNHSKLATGIGIILAGFNPSNNPNAAIDFLNKQMDRDLTSQRENLSQKNNLLSANLRQFGNLRDATDMTRLMQSDIMQNELQQAAAKASSPLAKAAALQAAGELKMKVAPIMQQFAMRRAMMSMANGNNPDATDHMLGYMRVMNPEMAKEMEGRYVPGVGMGKVPVPAGVRDEIVSHQKLQSIGQDVLNYSKTHTNLVPGTAEYNTGVQKAQILQQAIREGLLGTVFRESEKPLLEKFVDDNPAGALKSLSSQPKIRTILDSNKMQLNLLKRNYGLPEQVEQDQTQAAKQWLQNNPNDPRADIIRKHLGK